MNNKNKAMMIGAAISTVVIGMIIVIKKIMPKVSLKKYTKDCLYIAVMDDEIARNNFEGKKVGDGRMIVFPERRESLIYRYRMHLNLYKKYTKEELEKEVELYEELLVESREYSKQDIDTIEIEPIGI